MMTTEQYYQLVSANMPEIAKICTHPGEDEDAKRRNLEKGLDVLLDGKP